jgi:hypothetical protein
LKERLFKDLLRLKRPMAPDLAEPAAPVARPWRGHRRLSGTTFTLELLR